MTLNKYPKFAFTPKVCNYCHRRFIFEGYKINYRYIFASGRDIPMIMCEKCNKNKED